jgi:regulator of cell morphogenesis and NO signaling
MAFDAAAPVREVILAHPEVAGVLERLGPLGQPDLSVAGVAARAGIAAEELLGDLRQAIVEEAALGRRDWTRAQTAELIDYILRRHHPFVRYELGRLEALFETLCGAVARPPDQALWALREAFDGLTADIREHLDAEERVLFPWLEARAQGRAEALADLEPEGYRHMKLEHQVVKRFFAEARRLTNDYAAPPGGPQPLAHLYEELTALEADFHKHIRLENEFLWPGAVELPERPGAGGTCPLTGRACPEGDPATCRRFWDCIHGALAQTQAS